MARSARKKQTTQPPPPAAAVLRVSWPAVAIAAALVLLTCVVFGQTLGHEFVNFDDPFYVTENPHVQRGLTSAGVRWAFTHTVSNNWHPLTTLSHMADAQLFGQKAGAHHFTNVLLHTATVLLLFGFLDRVTGALWRSGFVAALFAIHPLRAESVAWISERKDVLSGLFCMLTLWAYARYAAKPSTSRYVAIVVLFACGLMSKPMLVTVPLVLLLLDYWPLRRHQPLRKLIIEKLPLVALSAASAVATVFVQGTAITWVETISIWARLGNAVTSAFTYIRQLFWPFHLSPYYPHPKELLPLASVVVAGLVLAAITLLVARYGRERRYLISGWLWYLVTLVPVIGIVQVGAQAHADRYTYLPHIGLYVMLVWGVADLSGRWRYRQPILAAAGALAVVCLAARAWSQTTIWHDGEKLWRHALSVTANNYVAHRNLAHALWAKNARAESIEQNQAALRLKPHDIELRNQVGLQLVQLGRASEGIAHWKKTLDIDPGDLNAQSNLAWVLAACPERAMRDGARAVAMAEDVISRTDKKTPVLLRTLAAAYAEAGRFADAIATLNDGINVARQQGDTASAAELRALISDFELGLPVRDPSLAGVQPLAVPY
jgi:protein O-mannosyl-transferase